MIPTALHEIICTTPQGNSHIRYYQKGVHLPRLKKKRNGYNALYICDTNTFPLLKQAHNYYADIPYIVLTAGEDKKILQTVEIILVRAISEGLDRSGTFIAFGGGVVCDITAFAASLYMRGISCILVPTTVLAMADASIGGKTAVNLGQHKNIVGSFYTASTVHICPAALHTLPYNHYHSGFAEILKMGALYDNALYCSFREQHSAITGKKLSVIAPLILRAVYLKAEIVQKDFNEQGDRSFLNFGHSFAHALEALSNFTVQHGDAVAWGMSRALALGVRLGITDPQYAATFTQTIGSFGWCTDPVYNDLPLKQCPFAQKIQALMKKDKKNKQGMLRLILQKKQGETGIYSVEEPHIREVLQ